MKLFVIFGFLLVNLMSLNASWEEEAFKKWKDRNSKAYSSSEEENEAKECVLDDRKMIKTNNQDFRQGKSSFLQKLWRRSDLTAVKRDRMRTGFKFNGSLIRFRRSFSLLLPEIFPPGPPSLDWRDFGVVTSVQDQGFFCGSCYAFSLIGAIEGQVAILTNQSVKLSEQQLIDCNYNSYTGNWGCDGGYMGVSYQYLVGNKGITDASTYPYKEFRDSCRFNSTQSAANVKGFVYLPSADEEVLKDTLAAVGPIAVAMDGSQEAFFNYFDGVYNDPNCTQSLTHAVLLIGYGTDPVLGDYWLCKNSWSTWWGHHGFFKTKRNANNHCGFGLYAVYPVLDLV